MFIVYMVNDWPTSIKHLQSGGWRPGVDDTAMTHVHLRKRCTVVLTHGPAAVTRCCARRLLCTTTWTLCVQLRHWHFVGTHFGFT